MMVRQLAQDEMDRYRELVRREYEIRQYHCDELRRIALETERLVRDVSERYDVHPTSHLINWDTGIIVPRGGP